MGLDDIIKPLTAVLSCAINKAQQHQEKKCFEMLRIKHGAAVWDASMLATSVPWSPIEARVCLNRWSRVLLHISNPPSTCSSFLFYRVVCQGLHVGVYLDFVCFISRNASSATRSTWRARSCATTWGSTLVKAFSAATSATRSSPTPTRSRLTSRLSTRRLRSVPYPAPRS